MVRAGIVRVGPAARRDIDAQIIWLHEAAGPDAAERLADAMVASFAKLAELPGIGSPVALRAPELADLRKWRVDGFPKHLLFYLPIANGVRIVRVFHAAQNWLAVLDDD